MLKLSPRAILPFQHLMLWISHLTVRPIKTWTTLKMSSLRAQKTMTHLNTLPLQKIMKKPHLCQFRIRLTNRLMMVQRMSWSKLKVLLKKMKSARIVTMKMMITSYLRPLCKKTT